MKIRRTQYTFARLVSYYYKIDFNNTRLKHVTFVSVHTIAAAFVVVVVVFVRIARILYFFLFKNSNLLCLFSNNNEFNKSRDVCVRERESEKQKNSPDDLFFLYSL